MSSHELLKNEYSFIEAENLQIKYRKRIQKQKKKQKFYINISEVNYVIGLDISYFQKQDQEYGIACAVLWDYNQSKFIDKYFSQSPINFPYRAGFLGFRENRILSKAIKKSDIEPDILMCDGHGVIHPKRFGEATHLGVALKIPSLGVAKNPFVGFSDWKELKRIKGNKTEIWEKNPINNPPETNEKMGYAVCLDDGNKPVFVSPGYKITPMCALEIALKTTLTHRQPEPIYLADKFSRKKLPNK